MGGTVIISLAMIWLFYESIKSKKNNGNNKNNDNLNGSLSDLKNEIKLMNTNHLHAIELAINNGNKEIVSSINCMRVEMIEKLSEICGHLKR